MIKSIALTAIALAVSSSVFAQVSNFTGASAGVNLDQTAVTTELKSGTAVVDGVGQQSVGVSIQGSYGYALSNTVVISGGATYSLKNLNAGEMHDSGVITFKAKNLYSLYLEPGYLVSEKTLAYGKVSYDSAKVAADVTGTSGASENVHGMGYGFGIRTMLDKNLSLQAEVKSVKYGSKNFEAGSTFQTTATVGTIGLGYKF